MMSVRFISPVLALALATVSARATTPAAAQEYPSKTVTIVVPLAPGTGMDSVARIYAEELAKALGKSVVVENQPGAALMLATQNVAKATPDGHTLLVSTTLPMTAAHLLSKKVNYDPDRDFVPLSMYLIPESQMFDLWSNIARRYPRAGLVWRLRASKNQIPASDPKFKSQIFRSPV